MTKEFLQSVKQEIINLKENATEAELKKLNISHFDPKNGGRCIYGLMTGSCFSDRAHELILLCATGITNHITDIEYPFEELNKDLVSIRYTTGFFTPLEAYIYNEKSLIVHIEILSFLNGESKKLPTVFQNI